MDRLAIMDAIQARDPDGGEVQPTEQDYRNHQEWAIREHGEEAWKAYIKGGWADPESIPI